MPGGNGDQQLLRAVESLYSTAVPRAVREAYPRDELVNSLFLLLKSRRVRRPTRIQIRSAAIDHHRRETHYPRRWKFGMSLREPRKVFYGPVQENGRSSPPASLREEIADHLRDVRRRFGTDGLAVFLLSRVMELPARQVADVMDFAPDSALARSIAEIGGAL